MRFKILGPLEITADDGRQVAVTRRQYRRMLATLLLNAGRPCSPRYLSSVLWGDDRPLSPEVSLRSCVYGIRKLLPEPGRLQTQSTGYLINVQQDELDLHIFRDLTSRGRHALDSGDPPMAAELLTRALDLWREPPLADLPASADRERLLDQHKEVTDAMIDATLALGRHREVLAELRAIVAADPLREHSWAQLITALYRSGARAEALAAFGRVRRILVTAHGIEPGPELQDLHRKVLTDDPALTIRPDIRFSDRQQRWRARSWQPLCQLPASVGDFTGRAAELGVLLGWLAGEGMAVSVVTGMLGIGKSALAVRAAHLARSSFPDGQLFARMDDAGLPRDPQVVLAELVRGLGVPAESVPAPGFEREALYRSVLSGRRVLVLADGAASAAQVRPLLPGTAGSTVVVTSRARLADLDGARVIDLGGMPPTDAARLISAVARRGPACREAPVRASDERPPEAALAIAAACGYLPLALRIAGARLAEDPNLTIAELAEMLADEHQLLDLLVVGEVSVRAQVAAAAQAAGEPARRALALLAAAGADAAPESIPCFAAEDWAASTVAPALADAGLLCRVTDAGPAGESGYLLHPLVRAYAAEQLASAISH